MDKRKNNGNKGHSTKAKGIDRRLNQYKDVLDDALTVDDLTNVLKMLKNKAVTDKDTAAAKIVLEYYLGKPVQTIDQNTNVTMNDFDIKDVLKFDKP